MKNFLRGISIGLPLGMLLGGLVRRDEHSEMAGHMRQIWTQARRRAYQFTAETSDRARRFAQEELQHIPGNAGQNLSELLDRQAAQARENSSAVVEAGMQQGHEAILNRVSRDELLAVYGIGPVLADRVLNGRPYVSDRDVVSRGILSQSTFDHLRRQVLGRYRKSA